jgi:dipeptidyl aminopeptidase/acylaminoacyl peptidase
MPHINAVEITGPLGTLRGLVHWPDGDGPAPAVVLLHGFTGQHIEQDRLFVQAARHLSTAGFAVLRMDFYGSGDSDGDFDEWTVFTEVEDAVSMLDWLGQQPRVAADRLGVVGLSLGGCVTALLAGQDSRPRTVVLWNALGLPDLHSGNHPWQGSDTGVVGGFRVGRAFADAFDALDVTGTLAKFGGPGLVIQSTKDEAIFQEEADALVAALGPRGTLVHIQDADHTFRHPAWRRELFGLTTRWLLDHV